MKNLSSVFPQAAWPEASPASQGVDPAALDRALTYLAANVDRLVWGGFFRRLAEGMET